MYQKKKKSFYFLLTPHDKFLALSLLTPLKENPGVSTVIIKLSIRTTPS